MALSSSTDPGLAGALLGAQRDVLEMVAEGARLRTVLAALARSMEAHAGGGALVSILLVDPAAGVLRHGAAPNLPAAYNDAIDGMPIGLDAGSCGAAAHRGEPVIVRDIRTDPLRAGFRPLAEEHGLRACWSAPIRSPAGEVLGTFAIYHREPHASASRSWRRWPTTSRSSTIRAARASPSACTSSWAEAAAQASSVHGSKSSMATTRSRGSATVNAATSSSRS